MMRDTIQHEIVYPHSPERVWRALTDRDELAAWLMDNDFEPRMGHQFTFREDPQPPLFSGVVECEVVELDPPRKLAYTWSSPPALKTTVVTFALEPVDGGTRLRLEHTGFAESGDVGRQIFDVLNWGWGALLHEELNDLLNDGNGFVLYENTV